jgi:hypothetical protein
MTEDQNKSVEENNENAKARASLPEKFVLYNYKNFFCKTTPPSCMNAVQDQYIFTFVNEEMIPKLT